MSMFCPNCGTPCNDGATFCMNCGTKLNAAPQQPVYSAPQQPTYSAPQQPTYSAPQQPHYNPQPTYNAPPRTTPTAKPTDIGGMIKAYLKIIIAVVAVFGLIAGIMNLFGTYDVSVEVYGYESEGPLSDLRGDDALMYSISTYLMGVVGLAVAGLGGYTIYLMLNGQAGSKKFFGYTTMVGLFGTAVALLLALIGSSVTVSGVSASISINFTFWVSLVLNGALFAVGKVYLKDGGPLK